MSRDSVLSINRLAGLWTPAERMSLVVALLHAGWLDVDDFRRDVDAEDSGPEDKASAHRIADAIEAARRVVLAEMAAYRSREQS